MIITQDAIKSKSLVFLSLIFVNGSLVKDACPYSFAYVGAV